MVALIATMMFVVNPMRSPPLSVDNNPAPKISEFCEGKAKVDFLMKQLNLRDQQLSLIDQQIQYRDQQIHLINQEIQLKNQQIGRSQGSNLLHITDLKHECMQFPSESYEDFIQRFDLSECFDMLPQDTTLPPADNNWKRCQPCRKINSKCSFSLQAAHLVPLGKECAKCWMSIFVPFFNQTSCNIQPAELAAQYFVFGVNTSKNRKGGASSLHGDRNFIHWPEQTTSFDLYPRLMFIPLKNSPDEYFRPVEVERYLVMCSDADICIGTLVPHFTTMANDMDCSDPAARRAVEVFNMYLTHVAGYLRGIDIETDSSSNFNAKLHLASNFRSFLRGQSCIVVPKLPEQGRIAVLELGPDSKHGNPHPFFVALRSMNAWLFSCQREARIEAWTNFLKNSNCEGLAGTPLLLLPACRDYHSDFMTCLLCKSREIMENPGKFQSVYDDVWQLARACSYGLEDLSDGEIDRLDKVQLRDPADGDSDTDEIRV
jgi:hypothetical protein